MPVGECGSRIEPEGPVSQEVRRIDDRQRICLPTDAVNAYGKQVLAVLDRPGRVRLLPWKTHGEAVAKRREELLARERTPETLEALRQIEDRYQRISLISEPRFTPSPNMAVHLGVTPREGEVFYLWRYPDHLEVWSPAYRNESLPKIAPELEGLP
jgi:hypothetical protein